MVLVVGVIVVPAVITGADARDIGLSGAVPRELPRAIPAQATPSAPRCAVHRYDGVAAGEQAVRQGDVDVLVVDGRRLEWRRQADEQLQPVVTGAIQLVAVRERAAAAGISPDDLARAAWPRTGRERRAWWRGRAQSR